MSGQPRARTPLWQRATACGALVLASPVVAGAAAMVVATIGRPAFFRQTRAGVGGQPFTLIKLRTMRHDPSGAQPDEDRLTKVGRLLRSTSLDELPQLVNVVRGEMALVGPRPLPLRYVDRYTADQRRRLELPPGITGLAQVSGRNALSWEEKFALDVEYVEKRSWWLDLWILWRTAMQVLTRHGVSAEGHATMPEFLGLSEAA